MRKKGELKIYCKIFVIIFLFNMLISPITNIFANEVKAEVKRLAEMYGTTEEEITTHIGDSEVIGYDLKMRKALDFLKEN